MRVSVVVPAHDAEATLGQCLRALASQSLPADQYELIVVDDGSTDGTVDVARGFDITLVQQSRRGAPAARNAGLQAARAEWVAFTDADCLPTRSWLRALHDAVSKDGDDDPPYGVAGKTAGYPSDAPASRFVDLSGGLDAERHLAHPRFPFAVSGNLMYRRSALQEVGGFDERYATYEACDLHVRLRRAHGDSFRYEPRAVVLHHHRPTWRTYWSQQRGYGRGLAQFTWHYRDEVPWSPVRELRAWARVAGRGLQAALPASGDAALVRRGLFVKDLAQRLGFVRTYWSRAERARW